MKDTDTEYEFNNEYREILQNGGLCLSGMSPDEDLLKRLNCRTESFMSGFSITPNLKAGRTSRTLCFTVYKCAVYRDAENRDI